MEIRLQRIQCGSALFQSMAARLRLLMLEAGIAPGYPAGDSESVYRQMECIYRVLREESGCADLAGPIDVAGYYCALMLELGLHPLLIFDDVRVAAGVWLYEDYDAGQEEITGSEFAGGASPG